MADPKESPKAALIRKDPFEGRRGGMAAFMRTLPAWIVSAGLHAVIVILFLLVLDGVEVQARDDDNRAFNSSVEIPEEEFNFENLDLGLDPNLELAYDVKREADVNVPGPEDPTDAPGIVDAVEAPPIDIPPPPGTGNGQGGAPKLDIGTALNRTLQGGIGNLKISKAGSFVGGGGARKKDLLAAMGGNTESERAVGLGLRWLALHQAPDGHWSLDEFPKYHRNSFKDPRFYNLTGRLSGAGRKNDIAGTAFGLLPFLGAGYTQQKGTYAKNVNAALKYLIRKQGQNGDYGGGMYAHGLATIATCEAYALTSDPAVGRSAQRAVNFIVYAQDPSNGGWRYQPRRGGDTSVVGWQMMALKSGQMAGLNVPTITLKNADRYLDSVETMGSNGKGTGKFGYTSPGSSYTMSSVGLLCRQYLGAPPRTPSLLFGSKFLQNYPPKTYCQRNMYYVYYATQVMFHMGGDRWDFWNKGAKPGEGMREVLIKMQDQNPRSPGYGSWDPKGDAHGSAGGRIMKTSLCLLSLEVYYRHLPLYRRAEVGAMKKMGMDDK